MTANRSRILAAIEQSPDGTYADIARALGVSDSLVRHYAHQAGMEPRASSYRLDLDATILSDPGISHEDAAAKLGVSLATVRKRRKELGVAVPAKKRCRRRDVEARVRMLLRTGRTKEQCASACGCSTMTVYRIARP